MSDRDKTQDQSGPHPEISEEGTSTGTTVDLGEDLLEKTAILTPAGGPEPLPETPPDEPDPDAPVQPVIASQTVRMRANRAAENPPEAPEPSEVMKDVEILVSEGLLEDAKRKVREILVRDPMDAAGRKKLEEIHELELKQMFSEDLGGRRRYNWIGDWDPTDSSRLLEELDRDLELEIDKDSKDPRALGELGLFKGERELEEFSGALEESLRDSSLRDRLDMGVAFLQMELFELAARQFRYVKKWAELKQEGEEGADLTLPAAGLLAWALIRGGHPFDASIVIEVYATDPTLDEEDKIEFYYLMGRASEAMGEKDLARGWYQRIRKTDPGYRDIKIRLMRF